MPNELASKSSDLVCLAGAKMSSPNTFCQDHSNVQPVAKGVMAGDASSSASAHDSALGVHSDSISVGERAFATDKPPLSDHTTEAALPNNQLDQSTGVESGLQVLQVSKNVRQIGEVDSNNLQSPCKYRKTANLTDVIGQAYSQIDTMSAKINLAQTVAGECLIWNRTRSDFERISRSRSG